jgi:hypothetical protein
MSDDLLSFAVARRNARAALHAGWLAGGRLDLYAAPRPDSADDDPAAEAVCVIDLPSEMANILDGGLTLTGIASVVALRTGRIEWARAVDSSGAAIADYAVGETGSGAAVTLDSADLVQGERVSVSSFVVWEG